MFSLHAFATTSPATYSSLTNIPAAADPVIAVSGNFLYVPTLNQLLGFYAMGANMLRAQVTSPSLNASVPFDIAPVDKAAAPTSPLPLLIQPASPLQLVTDEPLQALYTSDGTGAAYVFAFLGDGPVAPVTGKIIHARATVTTPSSAGVWTNGALTLTNQLAEGNYQLVGARIEGAHMIAARFVFPGGNNATRPGIIAVGTAVKFDAQHIFRNGNMGVFGTFSNRVLPTLDMMNDGTTETATVILDLIPTA